MILLQPGDLEYPEAMERLSQSRDRRLPSHDCEDAHHDPRYRERVCQLQSLHQGDCTHWNGDTGEVHVWDPLESLLARIIERGAMVSSMTYEKLVRLTPEMSEPRRYQLLKAKVITRYARELLLLDLVQGEWLREYEASQR